jgi:hypothetical protein
MAGVWQACQIDDRAKGARFQLVGWFAEVAAGPHPTPGRKAGRGLYPRLSYSGGSNRKFIRDGIRRDLYGVAFEFLRNRGRR